MSTCSKNCTDYHEYYSYGKERWTQHSDKNGGKKLLSNDFYHFIMFILYINVGFLNLPPIEL